MELDERQVESLIETRQMLGRAVLGFSSTKQDDPQWDAYVNLCESSRRVDKILYQEGIEPETQEEE